MIRFAVAYLASLICFLLIDGLWLATVAIRLFRPTAGDMALDGIRWIPAVLFYLLYPIGIVGLAVLPGLRAGQLGIAALQGALLGLIAYGAYDLTNFATLKTWSWRFTLVDMGWGTALTAFTAVTAGWVVASLQRP
jgi:uncharacterized membrane protein